MKYLFKYYIKYPIFLVSPADGLEEKVLVDFDAKCHISKAPRPKVSEDEPPTQGPQNVQCQTQ